MEQLKEIAEILKSLVGNEYLYLDTPVVVKLSPHMNPVRIWALSVSPAANVYIMDGSEGWHLVEEKDTLIINSLYQRVKMIKKQYLAASNK